MRERVLHLINGEYFGGSARVLHNYLTSPARRSDVAVGVFFDRELARRCRDLGIETEIIRMRGRADPRAFRQALRFARRTNASIIHTHQVRNSLVGRVVGIVDGIPVVTHVHSPAFRETTSAWRNVLTGGVDRLTASASARFIAVSQSLAAELERLGLPAARITVIRNGVDVPRPASDAIRSEVRTELGIPAEDVLIGMVANFRPRKGTEVLIDACAQLRAQGARVHLLLVGEPFRVPGQDYGSQLHHHIRHAGLGASTTMTGFRADTARLIAALDAFVLPSLFGEGLPMVLLEAMGAGIPTIATPVEGTVEVIEDRVNGLLVPAGDPIALAGALRSLLADAPVRRRLATAGRERVASEFSTERMVRELEVVYENLGLSRQG